MKPSHVVVLAMLVFTVLSIAVPGYAKDKAGSTGRLLTGRVLDRQDNPLPDAVVYLSDRVREPSRLISLAKRDPISRRSLLTWITKCMPSTTAERATARRLASSTI